MSRAEKSLLGLVFLGIIVSLAVAFMVVKQKNAAVQDRDLQVKLLAEKAAELEKLQGKLVEDQTTITQTSNQLDQINSKAENLQTGLEAAEKRSSDLEAALKAAENKITSAENKVKQVDEQLDGKSADEIKTASLKAQAELIAAMADRHQLEAQLAAAMAEVQRVNNALHREGKGEMPPGLSGKVELVNKTWNFIVLNLGDKDGVVRNGVFVIYRNNHFIGRAKVVSTQAGSSIADILPDATKADIEAGDDVLN